MQFIFCLSVILPLVAAAPAPEASASPEPLLANGRSYADIGALRDDCGNEIGRLYRPGCNGNRVDDCGYCPSGTTLVDAYGRRGCANYYNNCNYDCERSRITPIDLEVSEELLDLSGRNDIPTSTIIVDESRNYGNRYRENPVVIDVPNRHRDNYRYNRDVDVIVDVEKKNYLDQNRLTVRNCPDILDTYLAYDDTPIREAQVAILDSDGSYGDINDRTRFRDIRHGVRLVEDQNDGSLRVIDIDHHGNNVRTLVLTSEATPTLTVVERERNKNYRNCHDCCGDNNCNDCNDCNYDCYSSPTPTVTVVNVPAYNVQPTPVSTYVEPIYIRIPTHTVHNIPVPRFTPNDVAFDYFRGGPGFNSPNFHNHNGCKDDQPSYLTINPGPTSTFVSSSPYPSFSGEVFPSLPGYPPNVNCGFNGPCPTTLVERPAVSIGNCYGGGCGYKKQVQGKDKLTPKDKNASPNASPDASLVREIVNPSTNTSAESIKDNMKVKARNKHKEEEKNLRDLKTEA